MAKKKGKCLHNPYETNAKPVSSQTGHDFRIPKPHEARPNRLTYRPGEEEPSGVMAIIIGR